jgi:hypothetical protein
MLATMAKRGIRFGVNQEILELKRRMEELETRLLDLG